MITRRMPILFLPLVVGLLAVVILSDALRASDSSTAMDKSPLVIVVDTTETMQPELDALAGSWPGDGIVNDSDNRLFHLVQYKDQARYDGSTNDVPEFQGWLDELEAGGGGACEDAMFKALGMTARGAPGSRALILSDAAPIGDRSNLVFIANKLIEKGVAVYPVISGWCKGSEFSQAAMFSLARMTGGVAHIHQEGETESAVRSTLNLMPLRDSILVENGKLDGVKVFSIELDGTVTTVAVADNPCKPYWCLTCTLNLQNTTTIVAPPEDIQLAVRTPAGKVLKAGDPGVEVLKTSGGTSFLIDVSTAFTDTTPQNSTTWEILVRGKGDHVLSVVTESALHLDYPGKYILTANKQQTMSARLATEPGTPQIDPSSVQFALKNVVNDRLIPLKFVLDNSGSMDWSFVGPVIPRRGLWYLAVRGKLDNGDSFERVHEVPIRVKGFRAVKPRDGQQVAGSSRTLQFQISNDEANGLNKTTKRVYELSLNSLLGWVTADDLPTRFALAPGETKTVGVRVTVPKEAKPGDLEETYLTVMEEGDFGASETLTVNTEVVENMTVYLPAAIRP